MTTTNARYKVVFDGIEHGSGIIGDPVASWTFDDADSPTADTHVDAVGGKVLTRQAGTVAHAAGQVNEHIALSSSGYLQTPDDSIFDLDLGTVWSIAFWADFDVDGTIACKIALPGGDGWVLMASSGVYLQYVDGGVLSAQTLQYVTSGTKHIVITCSGGGTSSSLSLYVNGASVTPTLGATFPKPSVNTEPMKIGFPPGGGYSYYPGTVDELKVFDYVVDSDTVDEIYALESAGSPAVRDGVALDDSVLVGQPSGGDAGQLDRTDSVVKPGGYTVTVAATSAVTGLFARRGGTETTLQTAHTSTATTIDVVGSVAPFSNGSIVYIDRETILLGVYAAGQYTGCTRGYLDSEATPHAAGAIVSSKPRFWLGRRAQLYHVDDVAGTETVVRTGILTTSPRYVNGVYELGFVDLQTELNREIGSGWSTMPATPIGDTVLSGGADGELFEVGDARNFSTTADSHVRFDWSDGFAIYKLDKDDVDLANARIAIAYDEAFVAGKCERSDVDVDDLTQVIAQQDLSVRAVSVVRGTPAYVALAVMTSRAGDAANGTYDVLPGVSEAVASTNADLAPKRMGAGIPSAWVAASTWTASTTSDVITYVIDEPVALFDFLRDEILWRMGGYLHLDADGKLAFRKYASNAQPADFELDLYDDALTAVVDVEDDESQILAGGEIQCNWDHLTRQYKTKVSTTWLPTFATYGTGGPTLSYKSRTLIAGRASQTPALSSPPVPEIDVVFMLDAIYSRTRNGVRALSIQLPWSYVSTAVIGAIVSVTDSRAPDGEGALGITSRKYEIVGLSHDFSQCTITARLEELAEGYVIAPSAIVSAVDAGTRTVTLDTTGSEGDLFDANPAHDFGVDWYLRLHDASDGFVTDEVERVESIAATNQIVLDAFPSGFTLAVGDLVTVMHKDVSLAATSTAGYDAGSAAIIATNGDGIGEADADARDPMVYS